MKNLRKLAHSVDAIVDQLPLTAVAWDVTSEGLYYSFGPSKSEAFITIKSVVSGKFYSDGAHSLVSSWDSPSPLPELDVDQVLNLLYLSHIDSLCLILAGGDIVLVNTQDNGGEKVRIVGSVDAGITAACWSPDNEVLALATGENALILMTVDFESIAVTHFEPTDEKLSKQVSLGWGKAETQFKGKQARALRDPTMPEIVDSGTLSPHDAGSVKITWRGDGAFLAVSSIEDKRRRIIRVFSREGILDSVSEPVDGLEGALSWRPAGNLIASIQRTEESAKVVFFERNGLRHGDFTLRLTSEEQSTWGSSIDLAWNIDSTVLAVSFKDRVQLWTMGNYHYYLKQEISIGQLEASLDVANVFWHPEEPLKLGILGIGGVTPRNDLKDTSGSVKTTARVHVVSLAFDTAHGPTAKPADLGLVGVVDGSILKLTPFKHSTVPPPMALREITVPKPIVDVAINAENSLVAILQEGLVSIAELNPSDLLQYALDLQTITLPSQESQTILQIGFQDSNDILVAIHNSSTSALDILDVHTKSHLTICDLSGSVFLSQDATGRHCFIQHGSETRLLGHPSETHQRSVDVISTSPKKATWIQVGSYKAQYIVFGLTRNGILFANSRELARGCTSFLVTDAHLIFTTSNHLLKFIHLDEADAMQVPLDEPEEDERCRNIERGAKLVAVTPSTYSLVLQMPRGNLEKIYPRALVLAGIRKYIAEKGYKKAFLACRSHKVDMNILCDYAPDQFLENVPNIIRQLKKPEHIDLFLSQLRDEDVTQTLYRDTNLQSRITNLQVEEDVWPVSKGATAIGQDSGNIGKVNRICNAFLQALRIDHLGGIQNAITAHVCKIPPDLDAGLRLVRELRGQDSELVDHAVEQICFLADVNELYRHSLGLYDLDLALLIAQKSQKDPREYLPYLQKLHELPDLQRRFQINDDLAHHDIAVKFLHDVGDFAVFEKYVIKHELYPQALEITRYKDIEQEAILALFATHLNQRSRFKEAGIVFESLLNYPSAVHAYRAGSMWRESLAAAAVIPFGASEMEELALALADSLVEAKEFTDAARIYFDYLHQDENGIRYLCKGYNFAEATRIASRSSKRESCLQIIDSGLTEGFGTITELLADCKSQLQAQVPRLQELREKKLADPVAYYDGEDSSNIPDNVSLAPTDASTSGGTFFTRYTNRTGTIDTNASRRTSKNRRREERKRARGKKGSVYEEEYLVNSIERLIERVNSVNEDVTKLIEGLLKRRMRERAIAVQQALDALIQACQSCLGQVFEVNTLQTPSGDGVTSIERPAGADGVLWDSLEAVKGERRVPTVKPFSKSLLLGSAVVI